MYCNKGLLNERSLFNVAYVKQLAPIGSAKEEAMHTPQADVQQGSELVKNASPENVAPETAVIGSC